MVRVLYRPRIIRVGKENRRTEVRITDEGIELRASEKTLPRYWQERARLMLPHGHAHELATYLLARIEGDATKARKKRGPPSEAQRRHAAWEPAEEEPAEEEPDY